MRKSSVTPTSTPQSFTLITLMIQYSEKVIKELYKRKLITINDTTALKENTMIFPMTIEHFVKHLGVKFEIFNKITINL